MAMHENERKRIILAEVNCRAAVSINKLKNLLGVSEATVRRDIVDLAAKGSLKRIRGGAEPLTPPSVNALLGKPYTFNESLNIKQKIAIAETASCLCEDGDSIIINGGTTTYQMMQSLEHKNLDILTNSWTIAEYLHRHTQNTVVLPGGTLYRDQNIILSPFNSNVIEHFLASILFIGAQGINQKGLLESDPLILQSEQKLMAQAEKVVVLVDSSKFHLRNKLILCPLEKIDIIITDDGIDEASRKMVLNAGVELKIVTV